MISVTKYILDLLIAVIWMIWMAVTGRLEQITREGEEI